jgi:hypothetical protein
MMRCIPRPSHLVQIALTAIATAALVCAPQPAFAQHGGGGHGGGGGGHFGGGAGHFGGGNSGGSHGQVVTSGTRSGGSPSGAATRPGTLPMNFGHGNPMVISRGPQPLSFARPAMPGAGFGGQPAAPAPQHVTIGFPSTSGEGATSDSRVSGTAGGARWLPIESARGGVLSFSGQGHYIWQNKTGDEDSGLASGNMRSGALLEARPLEGQHPHPFPPRRFRGGFGPGYGYGYGFGGLYPFGFGLGFGFGAFCDPFWDFGCDAYGYPGYGYYGPYGPGFYSNSYGDDSDTTTPDNSQNYGVYLNQNTAQDNSSENSANASTVLYLNDGTSFAVTNYWVADYKLHYVIDGARENEIDLDQIDVQRTVDENAARGLNFTLKPAPPDQR